MCHIQLCQLYFKFHVLLQSIRYMLNLLPPSFIYYWKERCICFHPLLQSPTFYFNFQTLLKAVRHTSTPFSMLIFWMLNNESDDAVVKAQIQNLLNPNTMLYNMHHQCIIYVRSCLWCLFLILCMTTSFILLLV